MGQALDHATRPSRLPLSVHIIIVFLLGLSFVTGAIVWRGQAIQANTMETPTWLHGFLVLHGTLNPFLCAVFGYLCCEHIRLGWKLKANLATGITMEFIFVGLIVSGIGLYYAGEPAFRDVLTLAHRVLGVLMPAGLGVHWVVGVSPYQKNLN
jgi:hypothetical protein